MLAEQARCVRDLKSRAFLNSRYGEKRHWEAVGRGLHQQRTRRRQNQPPALNYKDAVLCHCTKHPTRAFTRHKHQTGDLSHRQT